MVGMATFKMEELLGMSQFCEDIGGYGIGFGEGYTDVKKVDG